MNEQTKTIAEFMGWQSVAFDSWGTARGYAPEGYHEAAHGVEVACRGHCPVPDYEHDLNAMHEVEQELERRGLHWYHVDALANAFAAKAGHNKIDRITTFEIAHATAAQRAAAAYSVIRGAKQKEG